MKTERSAIEQKMEFLLFSLIADAYSLKEGAFGIPENDYDEMTDIFEEILDDCIKSKYRILGLVEKLKF